MLGNRQQSYTATINMFFVVSLLLAFFIITYQYVNNLNTFGFYELMNVAFDFDQSVFVKAIDGSYLAAITAVESIWIKHPFILLYSYISAFFQFLGFSKFVSITIICLSSVAASLFLMWKTFMLITKDSVLSLLLLFLLSSTSSIVSIAVVFDSYSLLSTWTALAIYLFCREYYQNKKAPTFFLAFIYVMLMGVTVYMVLLVLFIESFKIISNTKNHKISFKAECRRLLILIVLSFGYGVILILITYPEQFFVLLSSPLDYLKRVLWAVIRPGEQASVFEVFYILFGNGLIAPAPSLVPILDGFSMFDLRSLQYSILEFSALFLIYIALLASLFNEKRIIILPCFIFVVISFIFHIEYHDRGSLFLYTSHLIFPIFVCIAAGLKLLNGLVTKTILVAVIMISSWASFKMLAALNQHVETFL
jgi:hypothetical protein